MLEISLLGGFSVTLDGQPLEIPWQRGQLMLAYLALNAGSTVRRAKVAGLLWPDSDEANARNNLRQTLWRLRKVVGTDYLQANKSSVGFNTEANYQLDVDRLLEDSVDASDVDRLKHMVSAYQGSLLPGFYEEWVILKRERLQAIFDERMQQLLEQLIKAARWREVREWAERWLAQGQVPEPAYRALMLASAGMGDRAGVAVAFERCAEALEEKVGVEPSPETQNLFRKLTSGESFWAQKRQPTPSPPVKLPAPPTPFVGRENELSQLATHLEDPDVRLVTIFGPGGTGKTRLAVEAARIQAKAFADGVYFVSLAPIDDPGFISSEIAETLGLSLHLKDHQEHWEHDTQIAQLLAYLEDKQLLLVLDNVEHLLTSALPSLPAWEKSVDQLVAELIRIASDIKIVTTSRERLKVYGETLLRLEGLSVPEVPGGKMKKTNGGPSAEKLSDLTAYDAIELFKQAAHRVRPEFELTPENSADVMQICRLVGGMPLGIELAASWIGLLSPAEIAAEIRDSLEFLETDLGHIPDRQRSIRLVFDSTWKRLTSYERTVFQQLSIFRGGFTRESAETVAGASLRTLMGLVNKSLVQPDFEGRYHLHELLRQFAAGRLARDPAAEAAVRDRHCTYFASFLQQREPDLRGKNQGQTLEEIESEFDNVRAAWQWAVAEGKGDDLQKAMESLCEFLRIRGRIDEGWKFFQPAARAFGWQGFWTPDDIPDPGAMFSDMMQLLDIPRVRVKNGGDQRITLSKILARDNRLYCESPGRAWKACQTRQESLELLSQYGNRLEMAWVIRYGAHVWQSPWQVKALYKKALSIFEEAGEELGKVEILYRMGWPSIQLGDYQEAEQLFQQSLALAQKYQWWAIVLNCLVELGHVHWALGNYAQAEVYCRQGISIAREIGYHSQMARSQRHLASLALSRGDRQTAQKHLKDSLAIYEELGLRGLRAETLAELSWVALDEGDYSIASQLARESLALCQELEHGQGEIAPYTVLGEVALGLSDFPQAQTHFQKALEIAVELWFPSYALHALVGMAKLLHETGEKERALVVAAFIRQHPAAWQWSKNRIAPLARQLDTELPRRVVKAIQTEGKEKELEVVIEEVTVT